MIINPKTINGIYKKNEKKTDKEKKEEKSKKRVLQVRM